MGQYRLRITPSEQGSLSDLASGIGGIANKFCDGLTDFSMYNYTFNGTIITLNIHSNDLGKGKIDSVKLDIREENQMLMMPERYITALLKDFGGKEFFIEYSIPSVEITRENLDGLYELLYCLPNTSSINHEKYRWTLFNRTDVNSSIDPLDHSAKRKTIRKSSTENPTLEEKIRGFMQVTTKMRHLSCENLEKTYSSALSSKDDKGEKSIRIDVNNLAICNPSKERKNLSNWKISLEEKMRTGLFSNPNKSKINSYYQSRILPYLETGEWRVSWEQGEDEE